MSTPVSVTQIVCSHCAERVLSAVITVQPSDSSLVLWVPILIMGSIVNTMPGSRIVPVFGLPK